jgi:hypothetical protein
MTRTSKSRLCISLFILILQTSALAAAIKPHIVSFGKWTTVQWLPDTGAGASAEQDKPQTLKVRTLLVDTHPREFTLGLAHDVTDRLFVVRRAFRINDSLPQESTASPHWQWQRGGWLLVDRVTGRISPINLPEFDLVYSDVTWYRDYAAYCGVSDDGKKLYAVVAQISRRKPVLRKVLDSVSLASDEPNNAAPDAACPMPTWQRAPARVSFEPPGTPKQTFAIRGRTVDLLNESEETEDEEARK